MTKEHQLLILLSKAVWHKVDVAVFERLIATRLNWDIVFTQIVMHKIAALAWYHIQKYSASKYIPWVLQKSLMDASKIVELQQKLTDQALLNVCLELKNAKIQYCILKGFVLQKILYPAFTRESNDTDILINRNDFTRVSTALRQVGFDGEDKNGGMTKRELKHLMLNTYEFPKFIKETENPLIPEIKLDFQHNYSFSRQFNYAINVREELSRAICLEGTHIYYQDIIDLLIHQCTHAYGDCVVISEVSKHKAFRLRSYSDIFGLLDMFDSKIDNMLFTDQVIRTNTILPVFFCLYHCTQIFGGTDKINSILLLLKPYVVDDQFIFQCGIENGCEKNMRWDCSLEEKLFNWRSVDKVTAAYAELLERYAKYDNRMRLVEQM
jgi:hypothetical protein